MQQTLAIGGERRYSLRLAALLLLFGVGVAFVPLIDNAFLYAIVAGLVACWLVPIFVQWHRGTLDWFEPVHAMGFAWVVYFGVGAVYTMNFPEKAAYDRYILPYLPLATLYCLLGYLMLLAGYFLPWRERVGVRRVEEFPRGALYIAIPTMLGFAGFMSQHLVYRASRLGTGVASLISSMGQLAPLYLFAWGLGWLMVFSGRAKRSVRLLVYFVMIPATGIIILNSMNNKSMIAALGGIPLMAWWYTRKKLPWGTLIILTLVVVFVIFPFNNTFRDLDERLSTGKRLELTSTMIRDWDTEHYLDRSVGTFLARNAQINSVAVVLRDVPRWVPYSMGETIFVQTAVFFVPRVLWPDKPTAAFGREFGQKFRVVHILDSETNVAVTVPGELYWNFSLPGILFGMAIWGILLRLYYRTYGESEALDPIRRAMHMLLLIQFLHFEAGVAQPTVMVIRTLLVLEAYRFAARRFGLIQTTVNEAVPQAGS